MLRRTVPAALLATLPLSATAADTDVDISGFIKLDAMVSQYGAGAPGNELMDDFFVPSLIETGGGDSQTRFDSHARESRIRFTTDTDIDGHQLGTHLEIDFMVTDVPGSDERISNSNAPRMRHAFLTFDNWLFGQTWSTFYNVSSLPELNDFVGPVGTLFNRQPQVRYSLDTGYGTWHLAAENPESTLNDGPGSRITVDETAVPDLTARYDWHSDAGSNVSLAVMGRQLAYEDANGDLESAMGYGVSLAGRLMVGERDDFRFMANYGHLGRYLGLNAFAGGYIDDNGDVEPTAAFGALAAYRHFWTAKLRSTLSASVARADVDAADVGGSEAERYLSTHINLMYSPIDPMTFGVEYSHAERENINGDDGAMDRVQFSAKYAF